MVVIGKVRGLSNHYANGVERQEIWIDEARASGLPYAVNQRVVVTLVIQGEPYEAGLSATLANSYVWINPDLYRGGEKVRLADALQGIGIGKNEEVELKIEGLRIDLAPALA